MRKIITILGMVTVTVATTATVTAKMLKQEEEPVKNDIVVVEDYDASNHLYEDTFKEDERSTENIQTEKVEDKNEDATPFEDQNQNKEDNKQEDNKQEDNKQEDIKPSLSTDKNKTTGQFQGFADNSVIEVKIGDKYDVFRVSENIKTKLEPTKIGQTITFTYAESGNQKVITSID